jgi:hypothetical protein
VQLECARSDSRAAGERGHFFGCPSLQAHGSEGMKSAHPWARAGWARSTWRATPRRATASRCLRPAGGRRDLPGILFDTSVYISALRRGDTSTLSSRRATPGGEDSVSHRGAKVICQDPGPEAFRTVARPSSARVRRRPGGTPPPAGRTSAPPPGICAPSSGAPSGMRQ